MKAAFLALGIFAATSAMAQSPNLRRDRLGLSADRIVGMGLDGWERYYNARVEPSGVTRGVSYAVFVDAIREQNGRLYRQLPAARQTRLKSAVRIMKRYSDQVGKAHWLFSGGNAYDPEADSETLARAEGRMLRIALGRLRSSATRTTLSRIESSVATRQRAFTRNLDAALDSGTDLHGGMGRPRPQVAREARANATMLRTLSSQLKTVLAAEPIGIRYEGFATLDGLTVFREP